MAPKQRTSTSYTTGSTKQSTSYPSYSYSYPYNTTTSRPRTGNQSTGRPSTSRPRTGASTIAGIEAQRIICAVTESRGVAPTVGLAFVNLDTAESALCQISDSQTYVRTCHKISLYAPSVILITGSAANPDSKLLSIIKENLADLDADLEFLDRRYFAESTGLEYIEQLAFRDDVEAIKVAIGGNYFAVCCFAAVLKYIDHQLGSTFQRHTLRIKYEPSEGSMMIDVATIRSLELIQNLQNPKSRDCLFGLLNETSTHMGARLLRSNILQPSTDQPTLATRYDAVEELASKEEMFYATRQALKNLPDVDRILTTLIIVPNEHDVTHAEQDINRIIMLKEFVERIRPVYEALSGSESEVLKQIRSLCLPEIVNPVEDLIKSVINEDVKYAKAPVELRNQRVYAVTAGVNGLLDVARVTFKEAMDDAYEHMKELNATHELDLELKFENVRQFYLRLPASDLEHRALPPVITNIIRKKTWIECSTLDLMKLNQKIHDAHHEVLLQSANAILTLIESLRTHMSSLFRICEAIAMLDMLSSFAHLVTSYEYIRPQITDTLGIKAGRHPIKERVQTTKFIPNDVYSSQSTRFQIITGCNMSGKSTYIRMIALLAIMAQVGSFVPASYASFPILHQLFARTSLDDSIEANVSTFAAEMRETAFILRNIDRRSMAIVDELGRGTSTRDGLAIAIAIAEALVDSRALVWFATHFRELARIMSERSGVINLHLAVDISDAQSRTNRGGTRHSSTDLGIDDNHVNAESQTITMHYTVAPGHVQTTHYGLALASVVPLPAAVLETADKVARKLDLNAKTRKKTSAAVLRERRRKLILNLKEHLVQARTGGLEGDVLRDWLAELQKEFVRRMAEIDNETESVIHEEDGDESDVRDENASANGTDAMIED
ncbi:hypothetical protein NA57DRAFT_39496 [Rhizodiscina lignyota]|uniref:DNA mismatch repair protein MSH3 n=1 Tax=Rhizodiscina lignyota TaxID=1504668 RepID=A0A9P4ICC8_9PEZI|nr:hypothetical protein NA57DRAFT_39496 [Rhizodiscina lignyota]